MSTLSPTSTLFPTSAPIAPTSAPIAPTCQNDAYTIVNWVLMGVFLLLALSMHVFMKLAFRGVGAACKRKQSLYRPFEVSFRLPFTLLLMTLCLNFASAFAPWPCEIIVGRNVVSFFIFAFAMFFLWFLLKRLFNYLDLVMPILFSNVDSVLVRAISEAVRVLQMVVLVGFGIYVSSALLGFVGAVPGYDNFLYPNFVTLPLLFMFVPVIREAVGGLQFLADRPFEKGDFVQVNATRGFIKNIGLFSFEIRSMEGICTLVSFARFVDSIVVVHKANRRRFIDVTVPLFTIASGVDDDGDIDAKIRGQVCPFRICPEDDFVRGLLAHVENSMRISGYVDNLSVLFEAKPLPSVHVSYLSSFAKSTTTQSTQLRDTLYQIIKAMHMTTTDIERFREEAKKAEGFKKSE